MAYTINEFKLNHINYSLYTIESCNFKLFAKLFGSYLSYDTVIKYSSDNINKLTVGLFLTEDNYIVVYLWISTNDDKSNDEYIETNIRFKNVGSELIYLLDELVDIKMCSLEEVKN